MKSKTDKLSGGLPSEVQEKFAQRLKECKPKPLVYNRYREEEKDEKIK